MSAFGCAAKCVASSVSRSVIDDDADRGGGGELLGAQHGRDLLGAGIALCEVVERLQRARQPLSRSRSRHWPTALVYIQFRSFIVGWTYSERAPFLCEHHALSTSVGQLESFGGGLGGSRPASIRGSWSRMKPLLRIRKSAR